ncbi:acetyltransferase [Aureibacillus halotolerans]|uniref:Acetyltransferase EpsM n=1 Tax=Aureibacillus halotolerans TaxID=1508390 RepID=A0A4V3D4V3_9BACI|nr:acetyltransferase [Aureibacillus halotolerans]TDQ37657.1 acetyltransferase EpsM [Aureibacillus halotolerans]
MKQINLIGNGGHSKVIQDLIRLVPDFKINRIFDQKIQHVYTMTDIFYHPQMDLSQVSPSDDTFVIAIGDNHTRKKIYVAHQLLNFYETFNHPSAVISQQATIESGAVIMAGAVVQADAIVGAHTIINTRASVGHDCHIGAFAHIAPGATLTGNVKVGEGSMVGAGAVVIPGVSIGQWSTIGAGAVVTNDIPDYATAVGVPAKIRERSSQ